MNGLTLVLFVLLLITASIVFFGAIYLYCLQENKKKVRGRCAYTTALLQAWCNAHPHETIKNENFKDLVVEAFAARLMFAELFKKEYDQNTEYLRNLLWGKEPVPFRKLHLVV